MSGKGRAVGFAPGENTFYPTAPRGGRAGARPQRRPPGAVAVAARPGREWRRRLGVAMGRSECPRAPLPSPPLPCPALPSSPLLSPALPQPSSPLQDGPLNASFASAERRQSWGRGCSTSVTRSGGGSWGCSACGLRGTLSL